MTLRPISGAPPGAPIPPFPSPAPADDTVESRARAEIEAKGYRLIKLEGEVSQHIGPFSIFGRSGGMIKNLYLAELAAVSAELPIYQNAKQWQAYLKSRG